MSVERTTITTVHCDKCGCSRVHDDINGVLLDNEITRNAVSIFVAPGEYRMFDLCKKCKAELMEWLHAN